MLEKYDETVKPILSKDYQDLIIIVISQFDLCTNPDKIKA